MGYLRCVSTGDSGKLPVGSFQVKQFKHDLKMGWLGDVGGQLWKSENVMATCRHIAPQILSQRGPELNLGHGDVVQSLPA